MNRQEILSNSLAKLEDYYSKNPEIFILDIAISQVKLLMKIVNNEEVMNKEIIDKLKLGWIYSREFDGFAEGNIIKVIKSAIEIEREIKEEYNER